MDRKEFADKLLKTKHDFEYYEKLYPNKIRLLKNIENKGLNYTLNRCLQVATGDYIARMDGDDRCSADRFEKEVAVLDNRNDISIVSSHLEYFDEEGVWYGFRGLSSDEYCPNYKSDHH